MKKAKIVMISMFKNESKSIVRMLESCYKHIDYYILQNNGSTDGTETLVQEFFKDKDVPGFVYDVEEGWVSFGWNRDHLLQTCLNHDHGCDWILKMDCDEILSVSDSFDWSIFDNLQYHSFHVPCSSDNFVYYRAWMWNAKLPWKFNHDVAHETITLELDGIGENFYRHNLGLDFKHISYSEGESWSVPTKYISDALKLEESLLRENKLLTDLYHFWYVGKSYIDALNPNLYPLPTQNKEFTRRAIYYFQEYLNVTHNYDETKTADRIDEMAYMAMVLISRCYHSLGDAEKSIEYAIASNNFSPDRNDHLVHLAEVYHQLGKYDLMLECTSKMMEPSRINPFPTYYFLINSEIYHDTGSYVQELHKEALEKPSVKTFNFTIKKPNQILWVSDDFYEKPDDIREYALSVEYSGESDWYKGYRSKQQHIFPGTREKFEYIMNRKINNFNEYYPMCGRFQYCTPNDKIVYHFDTQQYAAMIYLSPDAPYNTGTSLYASNITGARNMDDPNSNNSFEYGFYDGSKFDAVDSVGNIYNRLVIFNARSFHSAMGYFGINKETARLTHLFFFD